MTVEPTEITDERDPTCRKARVLVVDDSRDNALLSAAILTRQGHAVLAVGSGAEALSCVQEFRPDVMLVDIAMPHMNGYELARRVRKEVGFEHVIIVAVTGYGRESDKRQALEAEIDHHLLKPINRVDLDRILADWESGEARHSVHG